MASSREKKIICVFVCLFVCVKFFSAAFHLGITHSNKSSAIVTHFGVPSNFHPNLCAVSLSTSQFNLFLFRANISKMLPFKLFQ